MKTSWTIVSIISRFIAVGLGLIQSIIIVKLVSVSDYGVINIVNSVAAVIGVTQSLGISSGSTREIASAKSKEEAFKIFLGSLSARYLISAPLVLGLFVASNYLGIQYFKHPEIIGPLRIFAVVLFIQALQSVLSSVIQGLKQFKFLFIYQAAIAVVSLAIYIPMVMNFSAVGYYYALLLFTIISTCILFSYVYKQFEGHINWPDLSELKYLTKSVFKIGLYIYLMKVVFTFWDKLGALLLGPYYDIEIMGLLGFAILVSSKIMTVSDAITDVTLPSMTEVFERSRENLEKIFLRANSKALMLTTFVAILVVLLKKDIFSIIDIVFAFVGDPISKPYQEAFGLINILVLAYWGYSNIDLLKSGLAVPMKKFKGSLYAYVIMLVMTLLAFSLLRGYGLYGYAYSAAIGSLSGYIFSLFAIKRWIGFVPLTGMDLIYLLVSGVVYFGAAILKLNNYLLIVPFVIFTIIIYAHQRKTANN